MASTATAKVRTAAAFEGKFSKELLRLIYKYSDGVVRPVPVSKMFESLNVRQAPFDEFFIELFKGCYMEAPEDVLPVLVEELPDGRLLELDGRTRKAAASRLALKTINGIVLKNVSKDERVNIAAIANLGGSREMQRGDLKMTFDMLLALGKMPNEIRAAYARLLPKTVINEILHHADRDRRLKAVKQARKDVANGLSMQDACKKHRIMMKTLKQAISGGKSGPINTPQGELGMLKAKFKNMKQSLTLTAKRWVERHDLQELETDDVHALYAMWKGQAKEIALMALDGEKAFENYVQNQSPEDFN